MVLISFACVLSHLQRMRAIRVKLDGELLHAIGSIKPRNQPLAAYVREALRRDIERQQIRQAAGIYRKLMRDNPAAKKRWRNRRPPLCRLPLQPVANETRGPSRS